jgi:hypothetical protein
MNNPHMTMAPSYFFPWRMPGSSGGKDYEDAIKGCVPVSLSVGDSELVADSVWTEPGNMLGPTQKGLQDLVDQQPANWVEDCTSGPFCSGQVVDGSARQPGPRIFTVRWMIRTRSATG